MRKFLKKWVVDNVTDQITGDEYSISVDPKGGTFWVILDDEEITGRTARSNRRQSEGRSRCRVTCRGGWR
jgi:hypothetical protein